MIRQNLPLPDARSGAMPRNGPPERILSGRNAPHSGDECECRRRRADRLDTRKFSQKEPRRLDRGQRLGRCLKYEHLRLTQTPWNLDIVLGETVRSLTRIASRTPRRVDDFALDPRSARRATSGEPRHAVRSSAPLGVENRRMLLDNAETLEPAPFWRGSQAIVRRFRIDPSSESCPTANRPA